MSITVACRFCSSKNSSTSMTRRAVFALLGSRTVVIAPPHFPHGCAHVGGLSTKNERVSFANVSPRPNAGRPEPRGDAAEGGELRRRRPDGRQGFWGSGSKAPAA